MAPQDDAAQTDTAANHLVQPDVDSLSISVVVPARDEELTLPFTLPAVIEAALTLPMKAEVLVVAPAASEVHRCPPVTDPVLRWIPVSSPGKFEALRQGVQAATGGVLIFVDADVHVEPNTFVRLAKPLTSGEADIVASRIEIRSVDGSGKVDRLERWAKVSTAAWHRFRSESNHGLWALPGAAYAIRRIFFPHQLLVPLVDDASIGLQASAMGARISYEPAAIVWTKAPARFRGWIRQKYRSRRGWRELARHYPDEVAFVESALRRDLSEVGAAESSLWLMRCQDRIIRFCAHLSVQFGRPLPQDWSPDRDRRWS